MMKNRYCLCGKAQLSHCVNIELCDDCKKVQEYKIGEKVFLLAGYAEYMADEENWYINKKTVTNINLNSGTKEVFYRFDYSNCGVSATRMFRTLEDVEKYLRKYLNSEYGHKWKDEYLNKIIEDTFIKYKETH